MNQIGKSIRALRREHNMTQDDLAEKLHLTRQAISNYENGKSTPDIELLIQIAELYGTDLDLLITGTSKKPASDSKKHLMKTGIPMGILTVLLLVYLYLHNRYFPILASRYYIVSPQWLTHLVILPVFTLCSGWFFTDLLGMVSPIRIPFRTKWANTLRIILRVSLILFLCVQFSNLFLIVLNALHIELRSLHASGFSSDGSAIHLIPEFARRVLFPTRFPFSDMLYFLCGAGLWFLQKPGKKQ